jgi:hypothetical protein
VSLGRIRARPSCTVARGPREQCVHGPRPRGARPVFTALARPVCAARARPTATQGAAQRVQRRTAATSPAHGRRPGRCGGAHRRVDGGAARLGVDGGVGDAASVDVGGHGGDGSDWAAAASDSGSRNAARSGRRRERRGRASGCRDVGARSRQRI